MTGPSPSSKSVDRSCPLCGSRSNSHFLAKENLTLVRCGSCRMIYANPVPMEMAGKFYDDAGAPFYLSPDKLESDYASVRFERELRLFQKFCKSGRVLDVGCSTGAFLFQLKSRGDYEVVGTDVSTPALQYARGRGVEIIEESFLDHEFGATRFEAITFWAVLEHLLEPKQFLEKAQGLLASGGHCFILVPNMNSLAVRVLGSKYRYIFPQHVNYFTRKTLARLAAIPGLKVVARGTMHFNPLVIWQDFRSGGRFVPDAERAALLKRTTAYKQKAIYRPLKAAYRCVEAILGRMTLADNLFVVLRKV